MRYFYLTVLILFIKSYLANSDVKINVGQVLDLNDFRKRNQDPNNLMKEAEDEEENYKEVGAQDKAQNIEHNLASSNLIQGFYGKARRNRDDETSSSHGNHVKNPMNEGRQQAINSGSTSSELDMPFWKDEFKTLWMQKKVEALNSTAQRGDVVNMNAARSWGRSCGDPDQPEVARGSCMMNYDCDAEYRIYRGDHYCGRTQYICCALVANKYDMYGGIDVSFADTSFETDSVEAAVHDNGDTSKVKASKERYRKRKERKKERNKRKKKMLKSIKKIVNEIRKILNTAARNGTWEEKTRTRELQKFINRMKKKFREDRAAIIEIHHQKLQQVDDNLQGKLNHVKTVNNNFMQNDTFRELIVNGTLNKPVFMRLLRSNPDMMKYIQNEMRRDGMDLDVKGKVKTSNLEKQVTNNTKIKPVNNTRRSGSTLNGEFYKQKLESGIRSGSVDDRYEYDIEYGLLYY